LEDLAKYLVKSFNGHFNQHFDSKVSFQATYHSNYSTLRRPKPWVKLPRTLSVDILEQLIGGEAINGQMQLFQDCIAKFQSRKAYVEHLINKIRLRIQKRPI
jgi:hypothetical protein